MIGSALHLHCTAFNVHSAQPYNHDHREPHTSKNPIDSDVNSFPSDCVRSVISNFDPLQELWDWSLKNLSNLELKARVLGVQVYTRTFAYVFGVHFAKTILAHTDYLNKTFQSTQMTAVDT